MAARRIAVGQFGAPHGVKGFLKLKSFCAPPENIYHYPLEDHGGNRLKLIAKGGSPQGLMIAAVESVKNREEAGRLTNLMLYVSRDALPEPGPGACYVADMEGLEVRASTGQALGSVTGIHDFGAGTLLEVRMANGKSELFSLKGQVAEVNTAEGYIRLQPYEILEVKES